MNDLESPRASWSPGAAHCSFNSEQTQRNRALLEQVLDAGWLRTGLASPGHEHHPLLRDWARPGPDSYLTLDVLAEDLRVLDGVPGLATLVKDLRRARESEAARHTVHSAALYARAPGARVERFYPQASTTVPDFDIVVDGVGRAVETKQLLRSDAEDAFVRAAGPLLDAVFEHALPADAVSPEVWVVVKDPNRLPATAHVIAGVADGLRAFAGQPWIMRSADVNLLFTPPQPHMAAFRGCHVLAPRSPRENLRAVARGRAAAEQLRAPSAGPESCTSR